MSYIQSGNINVFPTTYRTQYLEGKYTSENNFVNILNSLTDIDSYVLGDIDDNGSWQSPWLRVVIHGYYFEIRMSSLSANMWLGIKVERGAVHSNALVNFSDSSTTMDENNEFKGLSMEISATEPSYPESDYYDYYWLNVTDKNGKIVNRVRLKADSIKYDNNNSVRQELDSKQDIMSAGNGIVIDNNITSIDPDEYKKLQSLNSKGSDTQFIYFNSSGEAVATRTTKGSAYTQSSAYGKSQATYTQDGVLKEGISIYASVNSPDNSQGKVGDLWFKYTI